ncbi:SubName: Full=Uncharacterized protein {ECO:0000313/EMBL:CCA68791.1} [Serendipita indica DSM 11827]|uniref:Uncharacterized protein n=1 Tax=Serendipita indica (strain DSM 11827) TaxID=1109443 RepID=G4TBT9_SERID|nr:SubName: Full=Uncharacterized protein {ECO:0000313/EMBL:CCA68791.1} [Serendipita indica DSM 11827]CCA68791.1 hypothetical protein PIIN_02653 [Serendipita indica DSM 11827]
MTLHPSLSSRPSSSRRAHLKNAVFLPIAGLLPWGKPRCIHSISKTTSIRTELPIELWLQIIELVLKPSFATDETFQPENLYFFCLSLIIHQFSNPSLAHSRLARCTLRLVSRSFKAMVDEVSPRVRSQWILSYSRDNATTYPPCIRLDKKFRNYEELSAGKPYPHPVQTLVLQDMPMRLGDQETGRLISGTIQRPSRLTTLHLSFMPAPSQTAEFPMSMLSALPSLQTLSVASHKDILLNGPLLLPNLVNLFLICQMVPTSDLSEWRFPSLATLSIDTRGWPQSTGTSILQQHCDLIGRHRETILSLRISPVMEREMRVRLRAHLEAMPRLESLATDFVYYNPFPHGSPAPPASLRSLVHISSSSLWTSQAIASVLVTIIEHTKSIDTLTLAEEPFRQTPGVDPNRTEKNTAALKRLHAICLSRKIAVYGNMGVKYCCVLKAMAQIGNLRLEQIQAWYPRGY